MYERPSSRNTCAKFQAVLTICRESLGILFCPHTNSRYLCSLTSVGLFFFRRLSDEKTGCRPPSDIGLRVAHKVPNRSSRRFPIHSPAFACLAGLRNLCREDFPARTIQQMFAATHSTCESS